MVRLGDKSNFWPSEAKIKGPNGPCGPCSEIFYDYGPNPACPNPHCDPSCDCGRFSEVWNLVFTQFNRKEGGVMETLPAQNIDTGMGLERLVAVVQGKRSNYETDLFQPILKAIDHLAKSESHNISSQNKFIIADHIRAIVFAINDGITPSNKERGSVIRKLIYDSTDKIIRRVNVDYPLSKLVPFVIDIMKTAYPELVKNESTIKDYVQKAEASYVALLNEKIPMLEKEIDQIKSDRSLDDSQKVLRWGRLMYHYRDTHGLTCEGIREVFIKMEIKENWHPIENEFNRLMEGQRERSRTASKMTGEVFADHDLALNAPKTEFLGYSDFQAQAKILRLFKGSQPALQAEQGDAVRVVLDRTPFYAEAGGQIGDTGLIEGPSGRIRIQDTQKISDIYIHRGEVETGSLKIGQTVTASIDAERRWAIMRNHSATHLLQAALRTVLGPHVQQQGSLVAEDRLRFDFTHPKALTPEEMHQIETFVNEKILSCDAVTKQIMPIAEARHSGALAYFAEKYGETVRVVSIQDYSKEFCGGTHLDITGQIGLFKMISEGAVAQGIRRIEAITGKCALGLVDEQAQELNRIAQMIHAPVQNLVERIAIQIKNLKQLEKQFAEIKLRAVQDSILDILKNSLRFKKGQIIVHAFKDIEPEALRKISDLIKQKVKSAIIVLGSRNSTQASILISVTEDLIHQGIKANDLIQWIAPLIEGTGGGRPQLAQAGSKKVNKIEAALKKAPQLIQEKLGL